MATVAPATPLTSTEFWEFPHLRWAALLLPNSDKPALN